MRRRITFMLLPMAACALVGCAGATHRGSNQGATATTGAVIALGQAPRVPGELYFSGESSPASHGPFRLAGQYLVSFEQTAPEDPQMDFSGQIPVTASLQRGAGDLRGAVKLFGSATRRGRRTLTLHGRYVLDVSFGDFPYAVRFTPRP